MRLVKLKILLHLHLKNFASRRIQNIYLRWKIIVQWSRSIIICSTRCKIGQLIRFWRSHHLHSVALKMEIPEIYGFHFLDGVGRVIREVRDGNIQPAKCWLSSCSSKRNMRDSELNNIYYVSKYRNILYNRQ